MAAHHTHSPYKPFFFNPDKISIMANIQFTSTIESGAVGLPLAKSASIYDDILKKYQSDLNAQNIVNVATNMVSGGDNVGLAYKFIKANGTAITPYIPVVGANSQAEPGLMRYADKTKLDAYPAYSTLDLRIALLEKCRYAAKVSMASAVEKLTTSSTAAEIVSAFSMYVPSSVDSTGYVSTKQVTNVTEFKKMLNYCHLYHLPLMEKGKNVGARIDVQYCSNYWVLTEIHQGRYLRTIAIQDDVTSQNLTFGIKTALTQIDLTQVGSADTSALEARIAALEEKLKLAE